MKQWYILHIVNPRHARSVILRMNLSREIFCEQTLLECCRARKEEPNYFSSVVTSEIPVMEEEQKVIMPQCKWKMLVNMCVCICTVCVCVCAFSLCVRVCADIDKWAIYKSNLLPQIYEAATNHFGKSASEEGFLIRYHLVWASLCEFGRMWRLSLYSHNALGECIWK